MYLFSWKLHVRAIY